MTDVFHPALFEQKVRRLADGYQKRFGELLEYDIKAELERFDEYRETLKSYVVDGVSFMRSAQQSNMKIVVEGANVRLPYQDLTNSTDFLGERALCLWSYDPFP